MPSLTTTPGNFWDNVDRGILHATLAPSTCREVSDCSGLPVDLVKNHLEVNVTAGLLAQTVDGGVRYRLTLAGYKRLFALAETHTRPGHQAAA
jgi:hypothetical protein